MRKLIKPINPRVKEYFYWKETLRRNDWFIVVFNFKNHEFNQILELRGELSQFGSSHDGEHVVNGFDFLVEFFEVRDVHLNVLNPFLI